MHQAIKMSSTFLDLLAHVVVHFHIENVCYQVQSILVVLYFCVEPGQVEAISQIVLVDLAKVLVAAG